MARKATNPAADALAGAEAEGARESAMEEAGAADGPGRPRITKARAHTAGAPPTGATNGAAAERPRGAVEVLGAETESASADVISVSQGGIGEAVARTVTVRQGGIGRLEAEEVGVSQGGIGAARADRIRVEMGGVGAAMAGDLKVSQGIVGSALARDVRIEQGFVRSVLANRVTFGPTSGAVVVIARRVDGEVRTLLDWRGALALGAVLAVLSGLFRRRRSG